MRDAQRGDASRRHGRGAEPRAGPAVSTTTDATGAFRFPALAPGEYDVAASLTGFRPLKFERVEVLLGQIKRLVVRARSGSGGRGRSGSRPRRRSWISARRARVQPAAGDDRYAAQGSGLHHARRRRRRAPTRSPSSEASPSTARAPPRTGSSSMASRPRPDQRPVGPDVLPEFVDEIQVKSSGYTAEYGGSTGGVINVVTKSGTNNWRGDVLVSFEGDALEGGPRRPCAGCPRTPRAPST